MNINSRTSGTFSAADVLGFRVFLNFTEGSKVARGHKLPEACTENYYQPLALVPLGLCS